MEKLKRYLGLAVSLALFCVALLPLDITVGDYTQARRLTPFDRSIVAAVVRDSQFVTRQWWSTTDYIQRCVQGHGAMQDVTLGLDPRCNRGGRSMLWAAQTASINFGADAIAVDPEFESRLSLYANELSTFSASSKPSRSFKDNEAKVAATTMTIMDQHSDMFSKDIYAWVALILVLAALSFFFRAQVGSMLVWPFALAMHGLRSVRQAAQSVHDRV